VQSSTQVGIIQYSGRFVLPSVVQNNNNARTAAYRYINENGAKFMGVGLNVSKAAADDVYNAVNPARRDMLADTLLTT